MHLSEVLKRLAKYGVGRVNTWNGRGKNGITLGELGKYFPYQVGPRYPVETTGNADPELTEEEVRAIERRFGCDLR